MIETVGVYAACVLCAAMFFLGPAMSDIANARIRGERLSPRAAVTPYLLCSLALVAFGVAATLIGCLLWPSP